VRAAAAQGRALSVGLAGNAAEVFPEIAARGIVPDVVTDQTSAHDLLYGYVPPGLALAEVKAMRDGDPERLMALARAAIAAHVRAMLEFQAAGAAVFDNGNLIRTQAKAAGVEDAFSIPIFTEAFLRPLFARGIGPFRWVCLSGERADLERLDALVLELFPHDPVVARWIRLASDHVPVEGLPARIAWLGHGARTRLAAAANRLVRGGELSAPVAFTRDHLDAGAMAHPNIMTENMRDGSDAIADWPLLNAMANVASKADLVAIHSGGGGYAGFMTSAGVTVIADGTAEADERIRLCLTNDTATGVLRYADAGYEEAIEEAGRAGLARVAPPSS
jgi:urocanate hydratase